MDGLPEERLERRRTTDIAPISQCAPMLESVGRIAGVVAHDFGNLLTALDSRLELIAAILSDRPEVRALAEESMRTSAQGARLARSVLALSGRHAPHPEELDLSAHVLETAGLLRRVLGRGVGLTLAGTAEPRPCFFDPALLDAVLLSLALHARDMWPSNGVMAIRLSATWGDARSGAQSSHFQAIEISGAGEMPCTAGASRAPGPDVARALDLARLCTEYVIGPFTEDGSLRTTLLLAGSGKLPRTAGPTPGRPAGSPPAGSSATVLLVEDQPAVLRATAEGLRRRGWEVLAADGPEQAIDRLRASEVDILVTDIAMPGGVSGVDLARQARQLRPDLPVLLVSGFAGSALGEHGLKPGEFELMNKPFRPSALAERLLGMLRATGR